MSRQNEIMAGFSAGMTNRGCGHDAADDTLHLLNEKSERFYGSTELGDSNVQVLNTTVSISSHKQRRPAIRIKPIAYTT